MIDHSDLYELYRLQPDADLVSTLYLDITPDRSPRDLNTILNSMQGTVRKEEFPGKTGPIRESLENDAQRFQQYVDSEDVREDETRAIALFSCDRQDLWQAFHVPAPVGDRYHIGPYPYLRPLSALVDHSRRILFAGVDRGHAVLCDIYMNRIISRTTLTSEVPEDVRKAGFRGYEEKRISRHVDELTRKHLKRSANQARDMFREEPFDDLIIGGHSETINEFQELLHSHVTRNLIGTVDLNPRDATGEQILSRSQPLISEAKETHEKDVLRQLRDEAGRKGPGVIGLDSTLDKLNQNQVRTLLVDDDFRENGSHCPFCHTLSRKQAGPCRYCNKLTQPVEDLVDRMISATFREGGKTEHISSRNHELQDEGIGALLYY